MTDVGRHARSRHACSRDVRRRPPDADRKRFEVLHDCGEVELVAGAGETSQSHALEAMVGLQVRKSHLDLLALISRFGELRRHHKSTSLIAGILVNIARDFTEGHVGRAFELDWALAAVAGARTIENGPAIVDPTSRLEELAGGTDVEVALSIKSEVGA